MKEMLRSMLPEIEKNLASLIQIQSVFDPLSITAGAPFGRGISEAFAFVKRVAEAEGIKVTEYEGYVLRLEIGEGEADFCFLCHIDTVGADNPKQWKTDPFQLVSREGFWYGRGVNDDKGPLIVTLYLMIAIMRHKIRLNHRIQLIIGGDEERNWECMHFYRKQEVLPERGISPDGNFPIVNVEKGIRYYRIAWRDNSYPDLQLLSEVRLSENCNHLSIYNKGKLQELMTCRQTAARHPDLKENAAISWLKTNQRSRDPYLKVLDLLAAFPEEQENTVNLSSLNKERDLWTITLDLRWAENLSEITVDEKVKCVFSDYEIEVLPKGHPVHIVSREDSFTEILMSAYQKIMKEDVECLVKGGASYARVLKKGIAFGPSFPGDRPNQHQANENQSIEGILTAGEIYWQVLKESGIVDEGAGL